MVTGAEGGETLPGETPAGHDSQTDVGSTTTPQLDPQSGAGPESRVKFGDLKGTDVVSLEDASKLGTIDDVYFDLERRQVLGFRVKSGGLFSGRQAVLLRDIQAVGKNAVTVSNAANLNNESKFPVLQGSVGADGVYGSRVLTEQGADVGIVTDIDLDFPSGAMTSLVLRAGLLDQLQRKEHFIPMAHVKTIGEKLIVIENDAQPA